MTMKTLACGEIMAGCAATFEGETEEEILAQAGRHVAEDHGLDVTPEVVDLVRSHIREDRNE
jgi:predicted small metal-binding protein